MKVVAALSIAAALIVPSVAQAAMAAYANFPADGSSNLAFFFDDNPARHCPIADGKIARVSIQGSNSGKVLAEGCWEKLANGDYRIVLDDRFAINGEMIVKKDNVRTN